MRRRKTRTRRKRRRRRRISYEEAGKREIGLIFE